MNSSSLIELENVAIGYDNTEILDSINLSIENDQFWGILGPNGSGKTTLLKTLTGLIPPVRGNVIYNGKPVFGYVPQQGNFDHIFPVSVKELVEMGRYSRVRVGRSLGDEDQNMVMECLEKVGIQHLKSRPFRSLSGGEKQRALLARAVAGEPDLLVLDEPTASVDMKGEAEIMRLVKNIQRENELTVLMVTHFLNTVTEFADRIILIDKDNGVFQAGVKKEVLSDKNLSKIFGLDIYTDQREELQNP